MVMIAVAQGSVGLAWAASTLVHLAQKLVLVNGLMARGHKSTRLSLGFVLSKTQWVST